MACGWRRRGLGSSSGSWLSFLDEEFGARADAEDEDDGDEGGAGEEAEDDVEGRVAVAEVAEAPVGEAAATDAHEVHDAVAGGAEVGAGDLAEDRHVVAIEEAPTDAEEDEK